MPPINLTLVGAFNELAKNPQSDTKKGDEQQNDWETHPLPSLQITRVGAYISREGDCTKVFYHPFKIAI